MTVEQLRATIKAVPFQPFTLRLADGREIPVPHPDFILYAPNMPRIAVVTLSDATVEIIDVLMIVGLTVPPQPAAAAGP
jgi:hypothetical protein